MKTTIREALAARAFWFMVLALLGIGVMRSHAQTQVEYDACRSDAMRLCKAETQMFFATLNTLACMRAHRLQLSPKCSAVFAAHGM